MNKISLEPENDRNAPKTKNKITKIPHDLKMTKIPLKCKKKMTEIPPRPPKYPKPKKHGSLILSKSLQCSKLWNWIRMPIFLFRNLGITRSEKNSIHLIFYSFCCPYLVNSNLTKLSRLIVSI